MKEQFYAHVTCINTFWVSFEMHQVKANQTKEKCNIVTIKVRVLEQSKSTDVETPLISIESKNQFCFCY